MTKPSFTTLILPIVLSLTAVAKAQPTTLPCLAKPVTPTRLPSSDLVIDADLAQWHMRNQTLLLEGDVELVQGPQTISADRILYKKSNGEIEASGNVVINQPGYHFTTGKVRYQSGKDTVKIDSQMHYSIDEVGGRGSAAAANINLTGISSFADISYTTCPPEKVAWQLQADDMKIDRDTGMATVRHARLNVGKIPLIYLPYFQFPVDGERHSGLLPPQVRITSSTGTEIVIPYYFNLAPNYDLTIYPRLTGKRGSVLGTEFRYLTDHNLGIVDAEVAAWDSNYPGDNDTRYIWRWRNQSIFTPHLSAGIDYTYVSDSEYIDDYQSLLEVSSELYRKRFALLEYRETFWNAKLEFTDYDPTDDSADRAYERLPEISYNWRKHHGSGLFTELDASYARFENQDQDKPIGNRVDIKPAVGVDINRPWGFFKGKLGGRFTDYSLDRNGNNPEIDLTVNRSTYTASIDTGLVFERDTNLFGIASLQTLEPRIFYTYTPYVQQDNLPVFDSKLADFSFENLFRENRYTGADRVGDSNQLIAAMTTRFYGSGNGREWLRASLGQIFYFDDHQVELPGHEDFVTDEAALVANLYSQINDLWSVEGTMQWGRDTNNRQNSFIGLNYHDLDTRRYLSLTWRQRNEVTANQEPLDYTTLAASWPVTNRLHFIGSAQYSLQRNRLLDVAAGLEYDSCCWSVRSMIGRRADDETADLDALERYDTTFYLQFVMKGLGGLDSGGFGSRVTPRVSAHDHFEPYY